MVQNITENTIYPEANVKGYSTRVEPAILLAIRLKAEGKRVPDEWAELVVKLEHGEHAVLGPQPDFSLPKLPRIIDLE